MEPTTPGNHTGMDEKQLEEHLIETFLKSMLCIFATFMAGGLIRTLLKTWRFPYTVVLFLFGAVLGLCGFNWQKQVKPYLAISGIHPLLLLHIFLPVLIFESAFSIEAHMFYRAIMQCIILAVPGMLFCTVLAALFAKAILKSYNWGWTTRLLFGSILSATDPVAVVALLKECGITPTLTTVIEGESLLNDGAAIVIFYVLLTSFYDERQKLKVWTVVSSFLKTAIGAPIYGYLMAVVTIWMLSHVHNDSVVEITITISAAYLTFFVADELLKVSGVLAVVILGVVLSSNRSCISPEVEKSMHHFWEMLSYLANTLIFVICGIIIAETALVKWDMYDTVLVIATYVAATIFRFLMIILFSPILRRIGYGLDFKQVIVMTWGGLRGAVGLALALMLRVFEIDQHKGSTTASDKVLIQVSGIIVLTLIVNGTTMEYLLQFLGMREISPTHRLAMHHSVLLMRDVSVRSNRVQREDKFTAGANWLWVAEKTEISDPYEHMGEINQTMLNSFLPFRSGVCRECAADVIFETTEEELREIKEVSRLRVMKALKASLWISYEDGLISRRTLQIFIPVIDETADIPRKYLLSEEIVKNFMHVSKFTKLLVQFCTKLLEKYRSQEPVVEDMSSLKAEVETSNCFRSWCIRVYLNEYFEPIVIIVLLLNAIPLTWELVMIYAERTKDANLVMLLDFLNLFFCLFYIAEAVIKIVAVGCRNYFKNHWNKFAFVVAVTSSVESVGDIVIFYISTNRDYVDFVQFIMYLRLFRVIRAFNSLLYALMITLERQVSLQIYNILDLGHGFIKANEEVAKNISFLVDYVPCIYMPLSITSNNILEMISYVNTMEQENPSIAIALKSHQAARRVLNDMMKNMEKVEEEGLAEKTETDLLKENIETMMKNVVQASRNFPPDVDVHAVLRKVTWITNNEVFKIVLQNVSTKSYKKNQRIIDIHSQPSGIIIILSGVVKVFGTNDLAPSSTLPNTDSLHYFKATGRFEDYLVPSNSMGVLGFLVQNPYVTNCVCETDCELLLVNDETLDRIEQQFNKSFHFALWRPIVLKISAMLMDDQPRYIGWTQAAIKLRLEKGLLPNLLDATQFEVKPIVEDMVIIQGRAKDIDTKISYVGPSYIPSSVRRLHLFDNPTSRDRVVMIFLVNDRQVTRNNLEWVNLDDMDGDSNEGLCLKHGARKMSVMIDEGWLPFRPSSEQEQILDAELSPPSTSTIDMVGQRSSKPLVSDRP